MELTINVWMSAAAQVTNFDRDAGRGTIAENEMQCVMKHPGLYNPPLSCRFEPLQTNRAGICYFNSALWASLYDNHAAWQALGENNDFDDQSGQNVLNTALNAVRDALRRIAVGLIAFKKMDEHTFAGAFLRAIRKTFCKNLNVDLGDDKNTKDDECDWFYFGEDESGGDPFTPYRLFEYAIYHELPTWINWYSSKQDLPKCNNFANMMSEKVSEANAPRKFIVNIKPCGWGDGTEFQPPDIALEDGTVYMAKVAMLDLAGTHATIAVRVEKKLEHDIYCGSDHCKADCNCPGARLVGWKWYNHDDREALMISDKVLAAGGANIKGLIYEKKDTIYDDSKIPKIENDDTGSGD
uniref:Uncharacterized protein n=1 Tax=Chromera velia CCMP2878 TaxID=1169474 RepID=A0A0G4I9H5_9ALVE|eukprot:Cvel_12242.t1-p1 / transcript=Cvel_12242.t1 / gene=Cvel_12242 / organism=Chromera_velia_CCMP2878 / gene_product=hypothetical protein / transcript_product=hypothetical protein / location=Cvel_scaffold793:5840-8426(+) / protein_length=352 / sequence_SO=supercontig / SO=protein_coding / is_pseudo=false